MREQKVYEQQKFYDPDFDKKLIKDTFNNEICIYRDIKNHKPIYKLINSKKNQEQKKSESIHTIILQDLQKNNFIATKKYTDKYSSTSICVTLNQAEEFIKDVNTNIFNYDFYQQTLDLIKSKKHPFLINHKPTLCYNILTNTIYKGINQIKLQYANIINNNICNGFYSNFNVQYYNMNFKKKPYAVIVCEKIKENNYDLVYPQNYLECNTENKIIKKEHKNINGKDKLSNIVNLYFQCLCENKEYIPSKSLNSRMLLEIIEKNPIRFLNLIQSL